MSSERGAGEYDVECAACKLLAHKWTPQVIAVLLGGPHRFSTLRNAIPDLSEKVLSARLGELEAAGIVSRRHYPEIPPRVEYTLTPAGRALEPVIAAMDQWSRQHEPYPQAARAGSAEREDEPARRG